MDGTIFDIKEFAVFDGPGIRITVFLKGCPLRCQWCHNPEGLSAKPELMVSTQNCTHCGKCTAICKHPEKCISCGDCILSCPQNLRKICGEVYSSDKLSSLLNSHADYLNSIDGGVTFSGGEPTLQGEFLLEVLEKLPNLHKAIETCGYCDYDLFGKIIEKLDLVMMDLKIIDSEKHKHFTGVSNEKILKNLEQLIKSEKPFIVRIPVIPDVNDNDENFIATAELLKNAKNLQLVELLPYHKTAGAKYSMVKMDYAPEFDIHKKVNLP